MKKTTQFLNDYTDPSKPGSFSGISSFYRALKTKNKKIKISDVNEWAKYQDAYTLHKNKTKKFLRNQTVVEGINDTWQIDLCDMRAIKSENENYQHILTIIDVFSKKAWAVILKNKQGPTVLDALKSILKKTQPKRIHADKGSEFFNNECKNYLKKINIHLYYTNSEMKAAIVERFNRTIKEKMWRYFTFTDSFKYIDILDDLVESYNNSYHRSIKMTPNSVNETNESQVYINLYGLKTTKKSVKFKFKVGDYVRLSKVKKTFEKGYTNNWTKEIFVINKSIINTQPTYEVKDLNDEVLIGKFYENELQQVYINDDKTWEIDEILKTRIKFKKKEYFVSWKNYPSSFNSWVKEKNLQK